MTHTGIDLDRTGQHRTGSSRPVLPCYGIFLLHRLTDDCADGVCCVLLHLGGGVGVGVEREACGVVAQGSGEGFHVYAVLEGQGGEKVPHLMKLAAFFLSHRLQIYLAIFFLKIFCNTFYFRK